MKLKIDEKDPLAYTDGSFTCDIFQQLKTAPVESFKTEYELLETKWMMGRMLIQSATLMDDAELHYTNLFNNNG